jgi:hypothetical protein
MNDEFHRTIATSQRAAEHLRWSFIIHHSSFVVSVLMER